jgi:hypothetical protein
MLHRFPACLAVTLFAAVPAFAATFVVPPHRDLIHGADAIAVGSALHSYTRVDATGTIEMVTTLSMQESIKGGIDADTIDVVEPGGVADDGRGAAIPVENAGPGRPADESGATNSTSCPSSETGTSERSPRGRMYAKGGRGAWGLNGCSGKRRSASDGTEARPMGTQPPTSLLSGRTQLADVRGLDSRPGTRRRIGGAGSSQRLVYGRMYGNRPHHLVHRSGASANTAYLYSVAALNGSTASAKSAYDLATTMIYTDPTLATGAAGTTIEAVHVTELRTAVAAVHSLAGLGTLTSWTNSVATGATIKAADVTDLRTNLDAAITAIKVSTTLSISSGSWTDSSLSGVAVKAVHFSELRSRMN